uniref:Uncharacterized protein n=1 Tax=Myoviridae sp. ct3wi9 TaxID=2826610 RepID=A0A8S5MXA7_9CAUD|nr:MAG TPA: hypothetical protein [Myoviridae sp. ct3wi9]DAM51486.1 MAG TPA: hypothetical protein [Caudoviricetes sp.]DAO40799.1 MAG TPA: hypothetical protein [Bacteriophage sp.]DAN54971.1 MAG TPA: hypothetical protein [Caudoviricetes sp.]DAP00588.1 MAG TPA: hypothetical protein [Caudoviricetes sp.]
MFFCHFKITTIVENVLIPIFTLYKETKQC